MFAFWFVAFDVWLLCSWYDLLALVVLFGFLVAVYLLVEFVWFVIVFVRYGGSNDLVCGLLVGCFVFYGWDDFLECWLICLLVLEWGLIAGVCGCVFVLVCVVVCLVLV